MEDEFEHAKREMEELLVSVKSAILATSGSKGDPLSSYAPVYVDEDRDFHVYVSSMAKHASRLKRSGRASLMLIEDESASENLFARRRLTVDCTTRVIERDGDEWNATMDQMEKRLGKTMSSLRNLVDFDLIQLAPKEGRLVLGFGRAFAVYGEGLSEIGYVRGGGHKSK